MTAVILLPQTRHYRPDPETTDQQLSLSLGSPNNILGSPEHVIRCLNRRHFPPE